MATILGIDPGLATVGFGVIRKEKGVVSYVDCGVIKTPVKSDLGERLCTIKKDIEEKLDDRNFGVSLGGKVQWRAALAIESS